MTIRTLLVSAVSLLVTTGVSSAADPDIISGMHGGDLATIISELPPDHPVGTKATVTLVSLKRALRGCLPIIGYFAELQEQHAMTQTSEPGIKSDNSEGERTRGNGADDQYRGPCDQRQRRAW
jgi:hypothetical protein